MTVKGFVKVGKIKKLVTEGRSLVKFRVFVPKCKQTVTILKRNVDTVKQTGLELFVYSPCDLVYHHPSGMEIVC